MSGTQKPGRSATSAKVLAGSKNTPVSREPSPKPLAWGSGSGKSSGVISGPIVLPSGPVRSTTSEGEFHAELNVARRVGGRDRAETAAGDGGGRGLEIGVVEGVDEIHAQTRDADSESHTQDER